MRFLARWLSQGLGLALALLCGVLAMQAPAFTHAYASALLQVASDARRDIDQREESARQYYGLTATDDSGLVAALETHEPSNAQTLARSIAHLSRLSATYQRIMQSPALLQPIAAFADAWDDPEGDKAAIWELSWRGFTPQIDLSFAALLYGFGGLMLGSLMAALLGAVAVKMTRRNFAPHLSS